MKSMLLPNSWCRAGGGQYEMNDALLPDVSFCLFSGRRSTYIRQWTHRDPHVASVGGETSDNLDEYLLQTKLFSLGLV